MKYIGIVQNRRISVLNVGFQLCKLVVEITFSKSEFFRGQTICEYHKLKKNYCDLVAISFARNA